MLIRFFVPTSDFTDDPVCELDMPTVPRVGDGITIDDTIHTDGLLYMVVSQVRFNLTRTNGRIKATADVTITADPPGAIEMNVYWEDEDARPASISEDWAITADVLPRTGDVIEVISNQHQDHPMAVLLLLEVVRVAYTVFDEVRDRDEDGKLAYTDGMNVCLYVRTATSTDIHTADRIQAQAN